MRTDAGRRAAAGTRRPASKREDAGSLDDLLRLVVGSERERIDRLEERPGVTAESVSAVLPDAVAASTEERRRQLGIALEPTVAQGVESFARNNTEFLGEVLAPTIGVAVRKAVKDAIASMLERFNEVLETGLSFRSIQWRVEARRTGRPFSEVVLLRTLLYRVNQVFLIHSPTGLVLHHVAAEDAGVEEPDQVASMLEAIDSFMRETLRPQPPGTHLTQLEAGDLTLWVDRHSSLAVAAVVRGAAPREFGDLLREARERIEVTLRAEIDRFQSDVSPFVAAEPLLSRCLRTERQPPRRRAQLVIGISAMLLVVALGGLVTYGVVRGAHNDRLLRTYVEVLDSEPGFVVTSAEREGARFAIEGLRDPLARAPPDVVRSRGLPAPELSFQSFQSLDPTIVEQRVRAALNPPAGVDMTLANGALRVAGVAPREWIERSRIVATALPGVQRYVDEELRIEAEPPAEATHPEQVAALSAAAASLESTKIAFWPNSTILIKTAEVDTARMRFQKLMAAATDAGREVCVTVVGSHGAHALGEERTLRVAGALDVKEGASIRREVVGAGGPQSHVTFRVNVGSSCREGA